MPDLNLDLDYPNHRKTRRLVGLLGDGAQFIPIALWCYVGKYYAEKGALKGYTDSELESVIGWWGDPGKCVEALLTSGFIVRSNKGFFVHDWVQHQGHIYALSQKNKLIAINRWRKIRGQKPLGELPLVYPNQPTDQPTNPKNSSRKKASVPSEVTLLINEFFEGQQAVLGEKPRFNGGAAGRYFKKLLKDFSIHEIRKRMGFWFSSREKFIQTRSFRVEDFQSRFNALKDGPIGASRLEPFSEGWKPGPEDHVIMGFKKILKIPKDDKSWDGIYFKRLKFEATDLLKYFNGDWREAVRCIDWVYKKFSAIAGGSVSLKAVLNHAWEFKNMGKKRA